MILALGVTIGQLLGGVIVTVDILGLSWRPAFLINVPIGLLLLACAGSVLPGTRGAVRHRLDGVGVAVLILSMTLVVVPLTFGREAGWPDWSWIILALGVIGLGSFVSVERSTTRRGGNPLLNLNIFGTDGVAAGLLVIFLGFACYGGLLFAIALYVQSGLVSRPLVRPCLRCPFLRLWRRQPELVKLSAATLRWLPTFALSTMSFATALFAIVAGRWGWVPEAMLPLLLIAGSSHGFAFGPVVNRTATLILPPYAPALSGLVATSVQLAILVGLATLGTLYLGATPSTGISHVAGAAAVISAFGAVVSVRLLLGHRKKSAGWEPMAASLSRMEIATGYHNGLT